jgi:hypothetical protein
MLGTDAIKLAEHGLLGPMSPTIGGVYLLNTAGVHLANLRPWRWLARPLATLSLVANQSWIALPSDFLSFDGARPIRLTDGTGVVSTVTSDEILTARTDPTWTPSATCWQVALGYSTALAPRLDLDRTPTANSADYFTYSYRAGWSALASVEATIPVPTWCEPLYVEIVRECARAYTDDQVPNVRIDRIKQSAIYMDAEATDSLAQRNLGQMVGRGPYVTSGDYFLQAPDISPVTF